jgi:hypothetical protein
LQIDILHSSLDFTWQSTEQINYHSFYILLNHWSTLSQPFLLCYSFLTVLWVCYFNNTLVVQFLCFQIFYFLLQNSKSYFSHFQHLLWFGWATTKLHSIIYQFFVIYCSSTLSVPIIIHFVIWYWVSLLPTSQFYHFHSQILIMVSDFQCIELFHLIEISDLLFEVLQLTFLSKIFLYLIFRYLFIFILFLFVRHLLCINFSHFCSFIMLLLQITFILKHLMVNVFGLKLYIIDFSVNQY